MVSLKLVSLVPVEDWFLLVSIGLDWVFFKKTHVLHSLVWHMACCLKHTRTTRTPAFWGYPPPPHDYPYHLIILDPKSKEDKVKVTNLNNSPKFQILKFWNGHYTWHTFWSCLIRCANMKWLRWVLLKIQSGHDSVHRRTDRQGDTSIPPFQLRWSGGYNNAFIWPNDDPLYCPIHASSNLCNLLKLHSYTIFSLPSKFGLDCIC